MDFSYSPRTCQELQAQLLRFVDEHIYPAEAAWWAEIEANTAAGRRWTPLEVIEKLKPKARAQGLWNLFLPPSADGHKNTSGNSGIGLSNQEYAPLATTGGIVELVMQASPISQAVLIILLLFSVVAWAIIAAKLAAFRKVDRQTAQFIQVFRTSAKFSDVQSVCGSLAHSPLVGMFQAGVVKDGQRIFWNSGCAAMGYDLPAAVGAAGATGRDVVCVTGDGSLQMNLQELQTIRHHALPVKLFVLNNHGYRSIEQSQSAFFAGDFIGCNARTIATPPMP